MTKREETTSDLVYGLEKLRILKLKTSLASGSQRQRAQGWVESSKGRDSISQKGGVCARSALVSSQIS